MAKATNQHSTLRRRSPAAGTDVVKLLSDEGCVGSDSDVAVFQELGTSRIPPRSFLQSAAIASEDKIHRMAAATAVGALSGFDHNASDVREILHLLHRAGHALKELGEDLFDDDEDDGSGHHR